MRKNGTIENGSWKVTHMNITSSIIVNKIRAILCLQLCI